MEGWLQTQNKHTFYHRKFGNVLPNSLPKFIQNFHPSVKYDQTLSGTLVLINITLQVRLLIKDDEAAWAYVEPFFPLNHSDSPATFRIIAKQLSFGLECGKYMRWHLGFIRSSLENPMTKCK